MIEKINRLAEALGRLSDARSFLPSPQIQLHDLWQFCMSMAKMREPDGIDCGLFVLRLDKRIGTPDE